VDEVVEAGGTVRADELRHPDQPDRADPPAEPERRGKAAHAEDADLELPRPRAEQVLDFVGERLVELGTRRDAEAQQDQPHRPGHQAAGAADRLARG
jgi:hypothetical protein